MTTAKAVDCKSCDEIATLGESFRKVGDLSAPSDCNVPVSHHDRQEIAALHERVNASG